MTEPFRMISTITFGQYAQPDFAKLELKGWKHPEGLSGETIARSLTKTFGNWCIQIVKHYHRDHHAGLVSEKIYSYTEASISDTYDKIQLKGEGRTMTKEEAIDLISRLYEELESCV